jgi:hypothetical protein
MGDWVVTSKACICCNPNASDEAVFTNVARTLGFEVRVLVFCINGDFFGMAQVGK